MKVVRQVRKKESSLVLPATSLHLMQVSKFVQEYLHCQQKYLINLSAAAIHSHLPIIPHQEQDSFDIDLNVPYIESQHYDSNANFLEDHSLTQPHSHPVDIEDENFTDREGTSISSESEEVSCRQRKAVQEDEHEEKYSEEDFQFIKPVNSKQSQLKGSLAITTDPNNSTKESHQLADRPITTQQDDAAMELQHLQETAYFLQERERQRVERRLLQSQQEQENVSSLNRPSKKAIFLSKIEKEKSRKEIAQAINKERHHIKKFLK